MSGLQLVVAGLVQIALGLQHEEVGGHAGLELLLLGFEAFLGEGARGARRFHPLAVGGHLAGRLAHLGGDADARRVELAERLLVLQPRPGQVDVLGRVARTGCRAGR